MKKIIILIIIVAAGGYYFFSDSNPAPVSPPREEGSGEVMNPTPTPSSVDSNPNPTPPLNPNPPADAPTKDDMEDVDVPPAQTKTFNITGKNFSFSTAEMRVKKGDTMVINFESTDGFHDWVVDEFNAKTERVSTGGKTSVQFTADKIGTFEYYCSVGPHRAAGMKGKLIVE